jgi:acetyl-CoA C-acetyltransferase
MGVFRGTLKDVPVAELGALAIRSSLEKSKVDPNEVDEVFMGNVIGAGLGQNIARQCTIGAGLDLGVGATTINKVCGSSLRGIIHAARAILCGDAGVIVAGGAESMSRAPFLLRRAREGYGMGHGELVDSMIHDGLWDVYNNKIMGECGDMCAEKFGFTREQQDDYSITSYKRALEAQERGFFSKLITPVTIKTRKGEIVVDRDEEPTKFNEEKFRKLRPAFGPNGTVTAGNASGLSDGASAVVVMSEEKVKSTGIKPIARIIGHANVAQEPDWFTTAPVFAIRKLCDQLNLKMSDIDFFEINEAFAVVAMVAMKELDIPHEKVNVNGGAVSLGHPIGATGCRIVVTLMNAMRNRGGKIGIACLCIGGGEASALAIEMCE